LRREGLYLRRAVFQNGKSEASRLRGIAAGKTPLPVSLAFFQLLYFFFVNHESMLGPGKIPIPPSSLYLTRASKMISSSLGTALRSVAKTLSKIPKHREDKHRAHRRTGPAPMADGGTGTAWVDSSLQSRKERLFEDYA